MSASNFVRIGMFGFKQPIKVNETSTIFTVKPYPGSSEFADMISIPLGVSYEIIPSIDGAGNLRNGTWTGLLGMLFRREVDIILGPISLTKDRRDVFLFSYPYEYSGITFATRKPEYVPDAAAVLRPFSIHLWLAVLVCIFTMPVIFRAVLRKRHSSMKLLMFAISSILTQGMDFRPKRIREFLLLGFWFLGAGFVSYIYSALLLSFLTFPPLSGIKTIQDLADGISGGRYQTLTSPGNYLSTFMLQSSDERLRTIGKDLERNIKHYEGHIDFVDILQDPSEKKYAYIHPDLYLMPYKDFYFISEDRFTSTVCAFPISTDFCCESKLNDVIHRYWSFGILQKFHFDMYFRKIVRDTSKLTSKKNSKLKLNLSDLNGPFVFLIASHFLSFFILLLEICTGKFKDRQEI